MGKALEVGREVDEDLELPFEVMRVQVIKRVSSGRSLSCRS